MPREGAGLYDRLMATGIIIEPVNNKEALVSETRRLEQQLREAQVFDIQNVADYYHSFPREVKSWRDTDFPKVAPPFKSFFMEFRARQGWKQGTVMGHAIGILSYAYDLEKGDTPPIDSSDFPGARWVVESTLFIEDEHRWGRTRAWTRLFSAAQPNGNLVRGQGTDRSVRGTSLPAYLDNESLNDTPGFKEQMTGDVRLAYYPSLLALSFLHCKNVIVETEEPQAKLSKSFQKKHGRPLIKFHVLNIEPMKTVIKNEGQAEKLGLKRALHIVRGHFADYTEKGLFGRNRGIYWFDQHARGTAEQGVVLKDYNLNTPQ